MVGLSTFVSWSASTIHLYKLISVKGEQCIRRENKRTGRKKLKNEEEEETWLEDQPRRIIVFNKAEVLDWQKWMTYKSDDDTDDGSSRASPSVKKLPENAMQVRFPMRIQCYSRHHGEKLGYR